MNEQALGAMSASRRGFLSGAGALGLFAVGSPLLSACTTDPEGAGGAGGAGGSATVAIQSPVVSLDPPLINSLPVAGGVRHVMESFVSLDADGRVVPALAESWEVADDKVTWTLHLRSGVKFHDSSPWTAEVAKANLDRWLGRPADFPRAQSYGFFKTITAVDDNTLTIVTATPNSGFVNWLSYFAMGFHSGESLEKYGDDVGLKGIGTGPFKVSEFVPNERLALKRYDDYWGDAASLENLTISTVPDASGRVSMVQTGEAQAALGLQPSMVSSLDGKGGTHVMSTPSVRMVFIGINSQNENLTDVRVRQAFNYAVDSEQILKTIISDQGELATSCMPEQIPGFAAQQPYGYDVDKAKALLDDAGWTEGSDGVRTKGGKELKLVINTTDGTTSGDRATCEAVQGYLKAVGVPTEINVLDQNGYFAKLQDPATIPETTLNYFAYGSSIVDPTHALGIFEGSWSNVNSIYARYRSEKFDAAYDSIVTSVDDEDARNQACAEAQGIVWEDAPWIFLFSLNSLIAVNDSLKGMQDAPQELYSLAHATRA
jgi:peptide/nickel transport system substrate-binding protein